MKKNIGTGDRIVRAILSVVVAVLYFTGQITGIAAIVLGAMAIVFLLTSLISFCPLYALFRKSTINGQSCILKGLHCQDRKSSS